MKVLLDTHVWLWYLLGDEHLSQRHREIITDDTVELLLSSISVWEAYLLIEKERLPVNDAPAVWLRNALHTLPVREAGVTFAVALRSRSLDLSHQDPADRFIAATSIELKAPLLTADERLRACPDIECL